MIQFHAPLNDELIPDNNNIIKLKIILPATEKIEMKIPPSQAAGNLLL